MAFLVSSASPPSPSFSPTRTPFHPPPTPPLPSPRPLHPHVTSSQSPSLSSSSPSSTPPSLSSSSLSRRTLLHALPPCACSNSTSCAAAPTPNLAQDRDRAREGSESRAEQSEQRHGAEHLHRRVALLCALAGATWHALPAEARERRQKTDFPEDVYTDAEGGLRMYDIERGSGKEAELGQQVKVHFEVKYGALSVVSTRESKLLGGNRSISQPYEFTLGAPPGAERRRKEASAEAANGLFSAQAAPKPPKALYASVLGMKVGGKRSVLVPPSEGYGKKGYNEIPPGAQFQLIIDLLDVADVID